MTATLGAKFDQVEHGSFVLTEDAVTIQDLALSKEGAHVHVAELVVRFTPDWWEQKVAIDSISVVGGDASGTVEGFKTLRGSGAAPRKKPARVDFSSTTLSVEDFGFDLQLEDHHIQGAIAVDSKSLRGPFPLEVVKGSLIRGKTVLASAARVTTTLDRDEVFPLELRVEGLATSIIEEVPVQDVVGTVKIQDPETNILVFDLTGETDTGQGWSFDGSIDRGAEVAEGHLIASDIRPSQLPVTGLPIDPEEGLMSVDLQVTRDGDRLMAQGQATLWDLHIVHPRLARDAVVFGGEVVLSARADLSTQEVVLEDFTLQPRVGEHLSSLEVGVKGRLLYTEDPDTREYEVEMRMGAQPCQKVLDAVPVALVPGLREFELSGDTTLDLRAVVKMGDPDATVLEGGLDMSRCKIRKVPHAVAMLKGPFRHIVRMKSGQVAQVSLMNGHPRYVSFDEMNPAVAGAVVSTEDGSFWRHKGYRAKAFLESLRRNVELGAIRRGGSTLTMQTVKNVLLTHERTLSRKLQELFLTWVIEKRLSKQRILEIHLNVVEFGPGIYGIAHASDHYFGKSAADVTSLEAAFMATLLPRPVERHAMWCKGSLTPKHEKYVRRVHARMLAKGRITQEAYDEGEEVGVVFTRAGWFGEGRCLAEGRREIKGGHTQGAMSGLLGK